MFIRRPQFFIIIIFISFNISSCSSIPTREAGAPPACSEVGAEANKVIPIVSSISPAEGSAKGGVLVTINGEGFEKDAQVSIGEVPCEGVKIQSPMKITCVAPALDVDRGDLLVTNASGGCGFLPKAFGVVPNVAISPKKTSILASRGLTFKAEGGKEPYVFSLIEGEGTLDPKTGVFKAGGNVGAVLVRVTDALSTFEDAVISIVPPISISAGPEDSATNLFPFTVTGGVAPLSVSVGNSQQAEAVTPQVASELSQTDAPHESPVEGTPEGSPQDTVEGASVAAIPPTTEIEKSTTPPADPSTTVTIVKVTDAVGNKKEFRLSLKQVQPLVVVPKTAQVTAGSQMTLHAVGGTPPYIFKIESGKGMVSEKSGVYQASSQSGTETIGITDSVGATLQATVQVTGGTGVAANTAVEGGRLPGSALGSISGKGLSAIATGSDTGLGDGPGWRQVVLGATHTCARDSEGVKCWGDNRFGQLGDGTLDGKLKPVPIKQFKGGVSMLAAGYNHTCALQGGSVKCWGDNRHGQLGDHSLINSILPIQVEGLASGVQMISAGQQHTCAIKGGRAFCWGSNENGQLGDLTMIDSPIPVAVKKLEGPIISISTGSAHTCALSEAGTVKCWGYNFSGQLGTGNVADRSEPTAIKNLNEKVISLSSGGFHTCVLTEAKGVKCWGNNGLGQLGNNSTGHGLVPGDVEGLKSGVKSISSGYFHSCAVLEAHSQLRCWGYDRQGQLGNNTVANYQLMPVNVRGLTRDVEGVSAGVNHTCALMTKGIQCWGANEFGQFGNNSTVSSAIPVSPVILK